MTSPPPIADAMRPVVHFTPERNWMNDPNGMFYYDGEYHLFFQYNPEGDTWGHMSWGHAVSRDLITWEHLPVAIPEQPDFMIYSGSAVVDWNNTSGFGVSGQPPLVAVFTAHYKDRPMQNQHIAYSTDRGRTWRLFSGNPVLDAGEADFRDPKVFWHEPTNRWIMVVAFSIRRKLAFYASPDLKHWTHLSDFGPAGSIEGIWECPDLFPLPVAGRSGDHKWLLLLNMNPGHPAGGSGCQYFVGGFDGTRFIPEADEVLWVDHGPDFYAAVTWSDIPTRDGRRIMLGWMNNWNYANKTPTSPWRGMMSIPRVVSLRETARGYRLVQSPLEEVMRYGDPEQDHHFKGALEDAAVWLSGLPVLGPAMSARFEFEGWSSGQSVWIAISAGDQGRVEVALDPDNGKVVVDRSRSTSSFADNYSVIHEAPFELKQSDFSVQLVLDVHSLEVFVADGQASISHQVFLAGECRRLSVHSHRSSGGVVDITLRPFVRGRVP